MQHRYPPPFLLAVVLGLLVLFSSIPAVKALDERILKDVYSLAQLLDIAVQHDPSMRLAEIQIEEAQAGLSSIQAALRPRLIIGGDHQVENVINHPTARQFMSIGDLDQLIETIEEELGIELEIELGIDLLEPHEVVQTSMVSITLAQQLGANAPLRSALAKAAIGEQISILQRQQALSQLALQVQSRYHSMLKAYHNLVLAQQLVANAVQSLEMTEYRQSIGEATSLHVLQEKNALFEAENHLSAAQVGLDVSVLALLQSIGLDRSYLPEVEGFVAGFLLQEGRQLQKWVLDFETAVNAALENRTELIMARNQIQLAELDYREHQETKDWSINLTGRYMVDEYIIDGSLDSNRLLRGTVMTAETKWPSDDIEDLMAGVSGTDTGTDTDPWQVGINISYTFGDGRMKKAEEERLLLSTERAQLQYSSAQDGIYLETYTAYQQLEQAWRVYQLALEGQKEAEETYNNLEQMYHMGSVTENTLLEGALYVTQARHQAFSTGLDYRAQKGELARTIGLDAAVLLQALVGSIQWSDLCL